MSFAADGDSSDNGQFVEEVAQVMEEKDVDALLLRSLKRLLLSESGVSTQSNNNPGVPYSEIGSQIPYFGTSEDLEVERWVRRVDDIALLYNISDSATKLLATSKLRGNPKKWYDTTPEAYLKEWKELKVQLRELFCECESASKILEKMKRCKWSGRESFDEYFHYQVRLGHRANLPESEIINIIIKGIDNFTIKTQMICSGFKRLSDLLQSMKTLISELDYTGRSPQIHRQQSNDNNAQTNRVVTLDSRSNYHSPRTITSNAPSRSLHYDLRGTNWNKPNDVKCFNCCKMGHISRDCPDPPKPRKCYLCGQTGHMAKDCSRKDVVMVKSTESKCDVAKYLKEVKINGLHSATGLVDGGSAICTIRKMCARKFPDLKFEESNKVDLFGFGDMNKPVFTATEKLEAELTIDKASAKVEVWLVEDNAQNVDLIIGRSFSDQSHIVYLKKGDQLVFGHAEEDPFKDFSLEPNLEKVLMTVMKKPNEVKKQDVDLWRPLTYEDIKINSELPQEKRQELLNLVNCYRKCFALNINELGCTNIIEMEIHHRSGEKMQHVDALSRAPLEEAPVVDEEKRLEVYLNLSIEDQILMMQRSDDEIKTLIDLCQKEELTCLEKQRIKNYSFENQRLFYNFSNESGIYKLFVIPKSMRKSIVVRCHDLSGHFGLDRTVSNILKFYWFPRIRRYVKMHIGACIECLINKPSCRPKGEIHPIPPGTRPFEVIHIDHLGPLVTSSKNHKFILLLVDNLTKFNLLFPCKSTSSKEVLTHLSSFINRYAIPSKIISDRGTCFTSSEFQRFCEERGIHHTLNSPRHPQANGQVERVNRTVIPALHSKLMREDCRDWDQHLGTVERDLNSSINKTTGRSPFELLHGFIPSFHDNLIRKSVAHPDLVNKWLPPEELREVARNKIIKEKQKWKQRSILTKYQHPTFQVGEVVFMRKAPDATGESTKLQSKFRGPMVITKVLPSSTYRVSDIEERGGTLYATTAHSSQLKGWKCQLAESDDDGDDDDVNESCNEKDSTDSDLSSQCDIPSDVTAINDNGNLDETPALVYQPNDNSLNSGMSEKDSRHLHIKTKRKIYSKKDPNFEYY